MKFTTTWASSKGLPFCALHAQISALTSKKWLSFWFCLLFPSFLYGTWARTCHSFLSIGNSHGKQTISLGYSRWNKRTICLSLYLTRSSGQLHWGLLSIFTWLLHCGPFAQRFMQIGEQFEQCVLSFYSEEFLHSLVPAPILVRCFLRPLSTSAAQQLRPSKHIWFIINLSERAHMRRPISSGVSASEEDCRKGRADQRWWWWRKH